MYNILIFTRKGLDTWAYRFKDYLISTSISNSTLILSEQNGIGDFSLNSLLNNFDDNGDIIQDYFSISECSEIITRCRVLRGLSYLNSLKRINAVIHLANYIIDILDINIYVSVRIDTYVNDIIERIFSRRKLLYLGLWRSAFFKDYFIVTKRGELFSSSELFDDNENLNFIKSMRSGNFAATSINRKGTSFSFLNYLKKYLYLRARDFYLNLFTNFHSYRNSYREFATVYYIYENRFTLLSIPSKTFFKSIHDINFSTGSIKVLIALQVNPESTIDYYVNDLRFVNVKNTLVELVKQFKSLNFEIYLKDHPNMNGRRNYDIFKDIITIDNDITFINPNDNISSIIKNFSFVFTWSGTIAVEAFMNDSIPVTVAPPYKISSRRFIHLTNFNQLKSLSETCTNALNSTIIEEEKLQLASFVNSSSFAGSVYPLNKTANNSVDSFASISKILKDLLYEEK